MNIHYIGLVIYLSHIENTFEVYLMVSFFLHIHSIKDTKVAKMSPLIRRRNIPPMLSKVRWEAEFSCNKVLFKKFN